MSISKLEIPGFKAISDQIFERRVDTRDVSPDSHPHAVLIYGWGNALPKYVLKYAQAYHRIFPHASQFIILSRIIKTVCSDPLQSSAAMRPLIEAAFTRGFHEDKRTLVHCFSDTGTITYAATLNEYRSQFGKPLPHHLLVLDSSPAESFPSLFVLERWSKAMAAGFVTYAPWPSIFVQGLCAAFLASHGLLEFMIGRDNASISSYRILNDPSYATRAARRLYLYSKEDDVIPWEHVVKHGAEAEKEGYTISETVFDGSTHVGHMRKFPQEYWTAIAKAWRESNGQSAKARL